MDDCNFRSCRISMKNKRSNRPMISKSKTSIYSTVCVKRTSEQSSLSEKNDTISRRTSEKSGKNNTDVSSQFKAKSTVRVGFAMN